MLEVLLGLREIGAQVHLASCVEHSTNPWTDELCRSLRTDGICDEISIFSERTAPLVLRAPAYFKRIWGQARYPSGPPVPGLDFTTPAMRRWFTAVLERESVDRVFINYAYFAAALFNSRQGARPRSILDAHDLLSLNDAMQRALAPFIGPGPVFRAQAMDEQALRLDFFDKPFMKPHKSEFTSIDRFDVTLAITEREAAEMRASTRHTRVLIVPTPAAPAANGPARGSLALFPMGPHPFNLQGYAWFLRKVLPLICAECPEFELGVTGILYRHLILEYHPRVRILGFVADENELWKIGRMLVNPVFGGTGQPVKTIEAMAAGMPPVILERFASAAPITHGVNGFVARDEVEFADSCIRLWREPALCRSMGMAAMEAVRQECSRDKLAGQLQQALAA
jgi:hypothetical protein